jgi:hypothetical protein
MLKLVVTCPVTNMAILTERTVEKKFKDQIADMLVSVYCQACDTAHTVQAWECKAYPIRSTCRELQKAS